jgi:hypothetical protein
MQSPFQFGKIAVGEAFTDRENELKRLVSNFENRVHTILISPRRWGKSSLVQQTLQQASGKSGLRFCSIDLFNVRTEEQFLSIFSRELIKTTSSKMEEWIDLAKSVFQRVTPRISLGTDPMNDFDISFELREIKEHYTEILDLPERIAKKKGLTVVVCLDEFQNVGHFEDPLLFQKRLRAAWQKHQRVAYCLYGSKRHMLHELFGSPSMPFYKFGELLLLAKIERQHLVEFVTRSFSRTRKKIPLALSEQIVETMQCHPYYVQQLAHLVWVRTGGQVTRVILDAATEDLMNQNALLFQREIDGLTTTQVNFLRALSDGVREGLSSKDVLRSYQLGTSGNVVKIKQALEAREIIDTFEGTPEFVDPAFQLWMKRVYAK